MLSDSSDEDVVTTRVVRRRIIIQVYLCLKIACSILEVQCGSCSVS